MTQNLHNAEAPMAAWHRNLLTVAAVFIILLIAMGGVLCVTQSIRSCPDWPGCFGKLLPPLETSPILEFTHRLLAGTSGLLILAAAIAGLARARSHRWIVIPPLVATVLLVEVSYFGAVVVLRGIAPGWAAVDIGSALLVAALMVTTAIIAHTRESQASLSFRSPFARLALATVAVVYVVFVSGVLVAGKNSISGCLGWPVYSPQLIQMDAQGWGNILRLALSVTGVLLIVTVFLYAWQSRLSRPALFRAARRVMIVFLVEALLQVLLLTSGFKVPLLVAYTVTAALFWGLLVALGVSAGLDSA